MSPPENLTNSNNDESLKLAVAVSLLRSKLLNQQPPPPPPPPVDSDVLKWKRKAKERKEEIQRLRDNLNKAEDSRNSEIFTQAASCKCYFFDDLGQSSDPNCVGAADGSDHRFNDVLRRRFLRQVRFIEKRRRLSGSSQQRRVLDSRFEGKDRVQYTRDQLLQLREVADVPDDILKLKKDIGLELFGEEQTWTRGESNVPSQPQGRFSEPDNRYWRNRSSQFHTSGESRGFGGRFGTQNTNQFNSSEQFSSQFGRSQISSGSGGGPALIKADVPWSTKRGTLSEKDRVLKTVKGQCSSSDTKQADSREV